MKQEQWQKDFEKSEEGLRIASKLFRSDVNVLTALQEVAMVKLLVKFKPNTAYDYGVRIIVNVPFVRSRSKSLGIRLNHSNEEKNINEIEIFVPDRLISEVPKFFIGELRMLSSQIVSVERA